ncbi:TetR/AcrR family transcriptional regulator [Paenibacillus taiwanensis]|uniref:TetR/AcrR family transcriptional regulator n=1 Tax=Paenibacillus taiwanensis TaxID=401638 RepID=UPI0003F70908|nr:TetR/AcrR family transcriptional regulator [Paenibacillus taiwanensis]
MPITDKKETAKTRILRVASYLFYREGVRAVGIDRIIAESGVAKASFYRNFATKDDLVVAYLEQFYDTFMKPFDEVKARHPEEPVKQLYELIESLGARIDTPGYRGCPFANTAVEFPNPDHPTYEIVMRYHTDTRHNLALAAEQAKAAEPNTLADQLLMLFNGALITAYLDRASYSSEHFAHAAKLLIQHQLTKKA